MPSDQTRTQSSRPPSGCMPIAASPTSRCANRRRRQRQSRGGELSFRFQGRIDRRTVRHPQLATNRERLNELKAGRSAGGGRANIDAILRALVGPPLRGCLGPDRERSAAARFMIRASIESVPPIRRIKNREIDHLRNSPPRCGARCPPSARSISIGACISRSRWRTRPSATASG